MGDGRWEMGVGSSRVVGWAQFGYRSLTTAHHKGYG